MSAPVTRAPDGDETRRTFTDGSVMARDQNGDWQVICGADLHDNALGAPCEAADSALVLNMSTTTAAMAERAGLALRQAHPPDRHGALH